MWKSLIYKEWLKLRLYFWLLFVLNLALAIFLSLRLRHLFTVRESVAIWTNWIFKGYLFFQLTQYLPLLIGNILGGGQFLQEVQYKRLRLVLHLPLSEEKAVGIHLGAGVLFLTLILVPGWVVLSLAGSCYFPAELQANFFLTSAPWVLAGYVGYFLVATAILEPAWRYRIVYLVLGAALVKLFYLDEFYNAYARILPQVGFLVAGLFTLPLLSSNRFGKGHGL